MYKDLLKIYWEEKPDCVVIYVTLMMKWYKKKKDISVSMNSIAKGLGYSLKRVKEKCSFLQSHWIVSIVWKNVVFNGWRPVNQQLVEQVVEKESKKVWYRFKQDFLQKVSDIYSSYWMIYWKPKEDDKAVFWFYNRNTGQPTKTMNEKLQQVGASDPVDFIDKIIAMGLQLDFKRRNQVFDSLCDIHYNWANIYNAFVQQGWDIWWVMKDQDTVRLLEESLWRKSEGSDFWISFMKKYDIYKTIYCMVSFDKDKKWESSPFRDVELPEKIWQFTASYIDSLSQRQQKILKTAFTRLQLASEVWSYSRI